MTWYRDICKRFNEIKEKFPRLRYVIVIDEKSHPECVLTKMTKKFGGKCVWLKDYSNPQYAIAELEGIIVDPKLNPETVMVNQGEHI